MLLDAYFIYKIPKSGKYAKEKPGDHCIADYGDRGNCLKMIEDALEGIVYKDDCQVVAGIVRKIWGEEDTYRVFISPVRQPSTLPDCIA